MKTVKEAAEEYAKTRNIDGLFTKIGQGQDEHISLLKAINKTFRFN